MKPDQLTDLIAEAKSHAVSSQYDPADDPIPEATPDAVALAVAEFKARGQDDDAAALVKEFGEKDDPDRTTLPTWAKRDPTSFYDTLAGDAVVYEFAEWKSYTNPKTKRTGWISSKGLVRYTKPGGKDDKVDAPRPKPDYEVTPERVEKLAKHYHGLGPAALADFVKSMSKKVGSVQAKLAAAVAARVKELSAGKPTDDDVIRLEDPRLLPFDPLDPKPAEPTPPAPEPEPVKPAEPEPAPTPPLDLKSKDPEHAAVAILKHSPHVKRVFAAVTPALDAHDKATDEFHAHLSATLGDKRKHKELSAVQAKAENAFLAHDNAKPSATKSPPGSLKEWTAKRKDLKAKMEAAQAAAQAVLTTIIDVHGPKTAALQAKKDAAAAAVRAALLESAKPAKPAKFQNETDPAALAHLKADGALHRHYGQIVNDATGTSNAAGEAFVSGIVNHASDTPFHVAYGVATTGRGFCWWTGADTGTDKSRPYTVTVSLEVDKDHDYSVQRAKEVTVHELGHAVEHRKGLLFKAKQFIDYRCGDEAEVSLREKFGDAFEADEKGKKDDFDRVFPGSDAYYVGKAYSHATELFSMGLEKLYTDPVGFFEGDPEYAAFILHHCLS